jgi:hypothetical protein
MIAAIAARMSEGELQDRVRAMADSLGLAVQHIHDARRSWLVGWPDLVIIGTSVLYAELKSQTGQLSPDQARVGRLIERAGGRWLLWRPEHLLSGEIARELTALSALSIAAYAANARHQAATKGTPAT